MCNLQQLQTGEGGQAPNAPPAPSALLSLWLALCTSSQAIGSCYTGSSFPTGTGELLVHSKDLEYLPLPAVGSHCPWRAYAQELWSLLCCLYLLPSLGPKHLKEAQEGLCVKIPNFCFFLRCLLLMRFLAAKLLCRGHYILNSEDILSIATTLSMPKSDLVPHIHLNLLKYGSCRCGQQNSAHPS